MIIIQNSSVQCDMSIGMGYTVIRKYRLKNANIMDNTVVIDLFFISSEYSFQTKIPVIQCKPGNRHRSFQVQRCSFKHISLHQVMN